MTTRTDLNTDKTSAAAWVARFLKARGIDRVFGLQGGHIQPIWDHVARQGIRIVDVRHESAAKARGCAAARAGECAGAGRCRHLAGCGLLRRPQGPRLRAGLPAADGLGRRGAATAFAGSFVGWPEGARLADHAAARRRRSGSALVVRAFLTRFCFAGACAFGGRRGVDSLRPAGSANGHV
jgi:hypothetical protein